MKHTKQVTADLIALALLCSACSAGSGGNAPSNNFAGAGSAAELSQIKCGRLTVKQKERFIRHFFAGTSLRKIASDEGVHFTSVDESVRQAVAKLRTYFKEIK